MTAFQLPAGAWWDWEIMSWSAGVLTLAASTDLTYHHGLELVFQNVAYVECPTCFHHPSFREPTAGERGRVHQQAGSSVPVVIAFDHDQHTDDGQPLSGLIGAEAVDIRIGMVYRYARDPLEPGERLASWVAAPQQN